MCLILLVVAVITKNGMSVNKLTHLRYKLGEANLQHWHLLVCLPDSAPNGVKGSLLLDCYNFLIQNVYVPTILRVCYLKLHLEREKIKDLIMLKCITWLLF